VPTMFLPADIVKTAVDGDAVVYLDADSLVLRNTDELFPCPGFCGALRHSERLNSGVMVATPSSNVFNSMMANTYNLPSYTG
jgi:alpha-N-acetylglucosamine transferase